MPLIAVDARGITFRPSGARTRLLGLYSALAKNPGPLEIVMVVSAGRQAREICHARGIPCIETSPEGVGGKLISGFRLTGDPFRWADLIHRETYPVPIDQPCPTYLTIHDLRSSFDESMATSRMKGFYERRILPLAIRRLDRVIAVSSTTASDIHSILKCPEERIEIIANAIDPPGPEKPSYRHPLDGKRFILAFGHMEARKNLRSLLPAMRAACTDANFPTRTLVIAGRDFGEAERLREAMTKLEAPNFELQILTDVDDYLREGLLHHADCLIAPSLLEGFGLVPLEALARDTPTLVSDISAAREVLEDAAEYFDPAESQGAAASIRSICLDDRLRAERLDAGKAVLHKYSWEKSAERLRNCYLSSLEK